MSCSLYMFPRGNQVDGLPRVLKLCDAGYKVEFMKDVAVVANADSGKKVGNFKRSQGLYVGSFQFKHPASPRQEP